MYECFSSYIEISLFFFSFLFSPIKLHLLEIMLKFRQALVSDSYIVSPIMQFIGEGSTLYISCWLWSGKVYKSLKIFGFHL